jgi:hypothetical protein
MSKTVERVQVLQGVVTPEEIEHALKAVSPSELLPPSRARGLAFEMDTAISLLRHDLWRGAFRVLAGSNEKKVNGGVFKQVIMLDNYVIKIPRSPGNAGEIVSELQTYEKSPAYARRFLAPIIYAHVPEDEEKLPFVIQLRVKDDRTKNCSDLCEKLWRYLHHHLGVGDWGVGHNHVHLKSGHPMIYDYPDTNWRM